MASSGPRLLLETTHMRSGSVNWSALTFVQCLIKVVGQAENHSVKMETVFFFETLVPTSQALHHFNSECHGVILMKPSSSLRVVSVLPKLSGTEWRS